jgi:hypothetical protein
MSIFKPYGEWQPSNAPISLQWDREVAEYSLDGITREMTPSGRMRVIIEGEETLVNELLGKNFSRRWNALTCEAEA